jgi:hypothetical protein
VLRAIGAGVNQRRAYSIVFIAMSNRDHLHRGVSIMMIKSTIFDCTIGDCCQIVAELLIATLIGVYAIVELFGEFKPIRQADVYRSMYVVRCRTSRSCSARCHSGPSTRFAIAHTSFTSIAGESLAAIAAVEFVFVQTIHHLQNLYWAPGPTV